MSKSNAIRLLERAGVAFRTRAYEVDENALDAVSVARSVGVDPDRVFKTLVAVSDDGEHFVFCLPGTAELDLKKAAGAAGVKRIALIRQRDLLPLTGYIHGGCSPLGMKKGFPTWIDDSSELFETICVSGGARGLQIEIAPSDLANLIPCQAADLIWIRA
ncbi:MAG TPA: Cys-tRNA(Pro) deacylase [Spirochaetia bacterium]|nr:Cys-tRNA(Pro) deacylase [Spirochaetia bacterium]